MTYGNKVKRSVYVPLRSVIASPELAPGGNLILAVGREFHAGQWEKTEHIVLTPEETGEFLNELTRIHAAQTRQVSTFSQPACEAGTCPHPSDCMATATCLEAS